MKTVKRSPLRLWWERRFARNELIAALAISIVLSLIFFKLNVYGGLRGDRSTLYGTLAQIAGSILGLVLAAMMIILSLFGSSLMQPIPEKPIAEQAPLEIIMTSSTFGALWRVFLQALGALGGTTLLSLLGLIIDRSNQPIILYLDVLLFSSILAIFRLMRCGWLLEQLIQVVVYQAKQR